MVGVAPCHQSVFVLHHLHLLLHILNTQHTHCFISTNKTATHWISICSFTFRTHSIDCFTPTHKTATDWTSICYFTFYTHNTQIASHQHTKQLQTGPPSAPSHSVHIAHTLLHTNTQDGYILDLHPLLTMCSLLQIFTNTYMCARAHTHTHTHIHTHTHTHTQSSINTQNGYILQLKLLHSLNT